MIEMYVTKWPKVISYCCLPSQDIEYHNDEIDIEIVIKNHRHIYRWNLNYQHTKTAMQRQTSVGPNCLKSEQLLLFVLVNTNSSSCSLFKLTATTVCLWTSVVKSQKIYIADIAKSGWIRYQTDMSDSRKPMWNIHDEINLTVTNIYHFEVDIVNLTRQVHQNQGESRRNWQIKWRSNRRH